MLCFIALKKVVVQIILQRDSYCLRKWRYDYYNHICLQYWFKKFRAGNFEKWRQRPPNKDLIKAMLIENPRYSVQEMPLIFLEQKIWSEWSISIDIKFGFHNRLYESRLYMRLTSLAIWKRSFLKEAYMWRRDLDFVLKCVWKMHFPYLSKDNRFSTGRNLNFTRRKFFCPFGGIEKVVL